ncbi:MAG: RNA polymerase sporulation sigma factor SigK [Oscillospiraceae bacterium]|nr:RNA polymerase sporulation sigma factor SigK [Oscillospiraceae bacterium]
MLASSFLLLFNSALFTLRLGSRSGSFPRPLSAQEERSCVERWLEGDYEARNTLIEHNLRLVAHIIKKYYTSENEQDDLISIGTIGLIKGVSTYRPDKGVRLATYAARCIENEVLMHFRGAKKSMSDISLSESIDSDTEGYSLMLMDVLADEEDMTEQISSRELCDRLESYMDRCLDARELEIIRLRYGLSGAQPLTQRETAEKCSISRSYVSRLEKRALEKLKRAMEED